MRRGESMFDPTSMVIFTITALLWSLMLVAAHKKRVFAWQAEPIFVRKPISMDHLIAELSVEDTHRWAEIDRLIAAKDRL